MRFAPKPVLVNDEQGLAALELRLEQGTVTVRLIDPSVGCVRDVSYEALQHALTSLRHG